MPKRKSKADLILEALEGQDGGWCTGFYLDFQCGHTTALSTHVSHARKKAKVKGFDIECEQTRADDGVTVHTRYRLRRLDDGPAGEAVRPEPQPQPPESELFESNQERHWRPL